MLPKKNDRQRRFRHANVGRVNAFVSIRHVTCIGLLGIAPVQERGRCRICLVCLGSESPKLLSPSPDKKNRSAEPRLDFSFPDFTSSCLSFCGNPFTMHSFSYLPKFYHTSQSRTLFPTCQLISHPCHMLKQKPQTYPSPLPTPFSVHPLDRPD
jgi:hypothetical protein